MAKTRTERIKAAAFREVRANEPPRVTATRWYDGAAAAERQIRGIALAKARADGAKIPRPKK